VCPDSLREPGFFDAATQGLHAQAGQPGLAGRARTRAAQRPPRRPAAVKKPSASTRGSAASTRFLDLDSGSSRRTCSANSKYLRPRARPGSFPEHATAATSASSTTVPCSGRSAPCVTAVASRTPMLAGRLVITPANTDGSADRLPGARVAASCTPPSNLVQNQDDQVFAHYAVTVDGVLGSDVTALGLFATAVWRPRI
jgi:hypothetical protein